MGMISTSAPIEKRVTDALADRFGDFDAPAFPSIAAGVAAVALDKLFYAIAPAGSAYEGQKRLYLRTAAAPGYADQGDAAAPTSRSDVAGLDLPLRKIGAMGLGVDLPAAALPDRSAELARAFAETDGQHEIPNFFSMASARGGIRIGASTIPIPRSVGWRGQGRTSRFYVNPTTTLQYLFTINSDGQGHWIQPYPGKMSMEYRNFFIDGIEAAAAGKYPTFAEVGGSITVENATFNGIVQGFKMLAYTGTTQTGYLDQLTFRGITFSQPEDGSGRYFIDRTGPGDALVVEQLHASLTFLTPGDYTTVPRARSIVVRAAVGGRISESINGDHWLIGCDGITISGGHFEFGQVRMTGSSGTIADCTFWTHRPDAAKLHCSPILIDNIDGVGAQAASVVVVRDCGFIFQQGFHLGHNVGSLPDVDIAAGYVGHVHIERAYRKHRAVGYAALGFKVGSTARNDDFNRYSHMASVRSDIILGRLYLTATLPSLPSNGGGLNVAGAKPDVVQGKWDGASGTYCYRAVDYYDTVRGIGLATNNRITLNLTAGGGAPTFPLETPALKMIRLYRGSAHDQYDAYVDVPYIAGVHIVDFGPDVAGYPWKARAAGTIDPVNAGSVLQYQIAPAHTDTTNTIAYGNVTWHGYGSMTVPTTGTWRIGDLALLKQPTGNAYLRFLGWRRMTHGSAHVLHVDWEQIFEVKRPPSASAAELASQANAWNQQPLKQLGLSVWCTNPTGAPRPLFASSASPAGSWVDATGTAVINPA